MRIRLSTGRDDQAAIARLNVRLKQGGAEWTVYGAGEQDAVPGDPIRSRLFVADDGAEIRGAVWLREHAFYEHGGSAFSAGWAKYPVSESLVDPAFGGVAGAMIFRLLREQPRLMALGMGGHQGAFARLLRGMGWGGVDVPFLFGFMRPSRVLRRLGLLRQNVAMRLLTDVAALSGLGGGAYRLAEVVRRRNAASLANVSARVVPSFDEWTDAIWHRAKGEYGVVAGRDTRMLDRTYPSSMPVERLRVQRAGSDVGWACVTGHQFPADSSSVFAGLRVGLLADGFAALADVPTVVAAALRHLRANEADLVFSNQANRHWIGALEAEGLLRGPSQFVLYRSPTLVQKWPTAAGWHVNRGDCDGPIFW